MQQLIVPYPLDVLGDTPGCNDIPECITEVTDRTQFVHHNGMLKYIYDSKHEILKTQCDTLHNRGIT